MKKTFGDILAQEVSGRIGGAVANATEVQGWLPSASPDGMVVVKLDDYTLWTYESGSNAGGSATVLVPSDSRATGRWVKQLVSLVVSASTPAAIAGAGSAGVATSVSASDHVHADPERAAAGSNLTDTGTQTIASPSGWRLLPTLGQGGALTLGTTNAAAGDQFRVYRTSTSAYTYAVINGGVGAGTLFTFPVSLAGAATFQFDGTNWALKESASMIAATQSLPGTMSAADKTRLDNTAPVFQARGVCIANIASLGAFTGVAGGGAINGVTYVQGDTVLLAAQSTPAQNGLYTVGVVGGGTAPLTRVTGATTGAAIVQGTTVQVGSECTLLGGSEWKAMCVAGKVYGTHDPLFYPRSVRATVTLAGGTSVYALGATEGLFLYSASTSTIQCTRNTGGGTLGTAGLGCPAAGRTAGVSGTAAATVGAFNDNGGAAASETSTVDVTVTNW